MPSKLAKYRSKRDFKKTQEPSGSAPVRKAEYPRFVIQKHDASRLHYDLRLEHDGVFKSWAVTKGPSLNPKDKRLAVEVEDHPLDYGDFEGTIPKGEYGGGTVMLWDRGYWLPEGNEDIDEALRKGELKFVLAGDKLQGGWVLVRMKHDRDGGKRNNWLLIKHKDEWSTSDGEAALTQGQVGRLGPHHAADRRRQGQGADRLHADAQARRRPRCGVAFEQRREAKPAAGDQDRRRPPSAKPPSKAGGVVSGGFSDRPAALMVRPARRTWQDAHYRSTSRRRRNCGRCSAMSCRRATIALAKFLIGKILVRDEDDGRLSGRIVETEAYPPGDEACHARSGRTARNASLFLAHGHVYVYRAYGISMMLNIIERAGGCWRRRAHPRGSAAHRNRRDAAPARSRRHLPADQGPRMPGAGLRHRPEARWKCVRRRQCAVAGGRRLHCCKVGKLGAHRHYPQRR